MLEQNVEIYETIRLRRRARDARIAQADATAAAQVFEDKPAVPKWVLPVGIGVAGITLIALLR